MTVRLTLDYVAPMLATLTPHAYSDVVREHGKNMPGVRWDRDRSRYMGPHCAIEAMATNLERLNAVVVVRREPDLTRLRGPWRLAPADLVGVHPGMRGYQLDGVGRCAGTIKATGAALLADEMGLGKTLQAITTMSAIGAMRPIVIAPAIVVPHWIAQIKKWRGERPHESPESLPPGHVVDAEGRTWRVVSYEGFVIAQRGGNKRKGRHHIARLDDHDACVLDEIHHLMNSRSRRSRAIHDWIECQRKTATWCGVLGLSGTPMTARPRDLWHPLDVLWPTAWGTFFGFTKRYCDGHYEAVPGVGDVWRSEGTSRSNELGQRLRHYMVRRTKAEVAVELPPLQRTVIEVELADKARRDSAKGARLAAKTGLGGSVVAQLLSGVETYKLDAAEALAREVIASGGTPLLLTTRKATAQELGQRLGCPVATGEMPVSRRAETLQTGARGPVGCGAATLYSVTTGIDLVDFDTIVMVGLDWVPSNLLQGEARIHRIGQQAGSVSVYYLVGMGTIDEAVRSAVIDRLDTFVAVVGGDGERQMAGHLAGSETDDDVLAGIVAGLEAL